MIVSVDCLNQMSEVSARRGPVGVATAIRGDMPQVHHREFEVPSSRIDRLSSSMPSDATAASVAEALHNGSNRRPSNWVVSYNSNGS
jgi:hypothetical protein